MRTGEIRPSSPNPSYAQYLQSDHWKKLRRERLEFANYACEKCLSTFFLQVHHTVYAEDLTKITVKDLLCLCSYCHRKRHGIDTGQDRPIYTWQQRRAIVDKFDRQDRAWKGATKQNLKLVIKSRLSQVYGKQRNRLCSALHIFAKEHNGFVTAQQLESHLESLMQPK